MIFRSTSINGFELEEYALAIGYHGIHLDLNDSEFWRGKE
jgi:hypothetical protein